MILRLWNFLRGFVIIEVYGFSVARFVNLAAHKGIFIWDMANSDRGVTMKVSIKGFRMLKECAKKTKCHIKIVGKSGYPFIANRYRKRKILMGGVIFFIGLLYFLSSFVWLIEVSGNERLSTAEILEFCESKGLKLGSFKYGVDVKKIKRELINSYADISWVNVHIKGTRALITLAEILPKQEIINNTDPCNVVAKKDGIITSIATTSGVPMVRQNDVVKQGDILVSGEMFYKNEYDEILKVDYVHANAEVRAKMYYNINFKVPYNYSEKIFTGKTKKHFSISLLNHNFNLIKTRISYVNYDRIISHKQFKLGESYPLPIILTTTEYKEFIEEPKVRSTEQAKQLADKMVTGRIIRELDFEADVIDKVMSIQELEADGQAYLEVKTLVITIERIDEKKEINS